MRTIITFFAFLFLSTSILGQSPNKISYQAVIRNSSNTLVNNQNIGMQITILQGSTNGIAVFVESHNTSTNQNGLISIEIGGGSVVSGTFSTINWANGPYFIKTETDPTGGTNYSITGTSQLLSVPYALHAKTAENLSSIGSNGNFVHYIGEQFGGGVIFHLWKDNLGIEHGLIVDKTDLGISIWSNMNNTAVGFSAQSTWDGLSNSNGIIAQLGHTNSAAAMCLNSTNGGQTDWYLPSIFELNLLWNNIYTVARALSQIPGATQPLKTPSYWSSTEDLNNSAWAVMSFIGQGPPNFINKSSSNNIRAIRAF